MTGGGARAAYQVGFMSGIAEVFPDLHVPYLTGVSAGAINAAYMASDPGNFAARTEALSQLWRSLNPEDVFEVTSGNLLSHVGGWAGQLLGGGRHITPRMRGMLSTGPLRRLLERFLAHHDGLLVGIDR
ncbi:MAG: patatin-like phospholipase family protein, partial [Pseudomonadota bacterium]